jgi:hypothetical protein
MNANLHARWTGLRTGFLSLALIAVSGPFAAGAESSEPAVNRGDTTDEVVAKLGLPRGKIERKNQITYSYDRGMVNFIDGRVVNAFLVTPEEGERRKAEQDRAAEAARRRVDLQQQRYLASVSSNLAAPQAAAAAVATRPTDRDELKILSARLEVIQARRKELDAAFAASLANWKRKEIDLERAKLATEFDECLRRLAERQNTTPVVTSNAAAATATGR